MPLMRQFIKLRRDGWGVGSEEGFQRGSAITPE